MFTISHATLDDAAELAELLGVLFDQEVDFAPDFERQLRAVRLILESPGVGIIFVARENSQGDSEPLGEHPASPGAPARAGPLLGMASLLFTISTARGGPVCWLEDFIVRPERRGLGIGSALLGHAIVFARAAGYLRMSLQTDRANVSAQRLYQRYGFAASDMLTMRLGMGD